jgi:hypothetical protein
MWKEAGFFPHRFNPISVMSESVLIRVQFPAVLCTLCDSVRDDFFFREQLSFETKTG